MYTAKAYSAVSKTSPLALQKLTGAIQQIMMFRSKSFSAVSATPISIMSVTSLPA